MTTPEGHVKSKLREYLASRKAYVFAPVQTGYGAPSLDFICCIDGHFSAFECKAGDKKLTPRQEHIARQIRAAGGIAERVTLDNIGQLKFTPCGLSKTED